MDKIFDGLFTGVSVIILVAILAVSLVAWGVYWLFQKLVLWRADGDS